MAGMSDKRHYRPAKDVAEIVGVCERTIRRGHDAGHVRRKVVVRGLVSRILYSLADARELASERVE